MKRLAIVAIAFVVALIGVRFAVVGIEKWMLQDPQRLPPAWQIRLQARQMSQPVVADEELGFLVVDNASTEVMTGDFSFTRTTGAHGFPNIGPWPDRTDIVFLGDSLLLGEGVGVQYGLVAGIDALLADETAMNLANPGAGAERQHRIYRRFGAPLLPRLVVASLYLASDLENDRHFHAWLADPQGMDYESFRLSYRRRTEPPSRLNISKRLDRHPLYGWAESAVEPRLWGRFRIPHRVTTASAEYFLDRRAIEFARRPAADAAMEIDALFKSLSSLRTAVEAEGGARLVVMLIPSKEELFAAPPGKDGVLATVTARLSAEGIPYLDLYPVLRRRETEAATYFPRDIHLSRFGNRVAAEAFVEWRSTLPKVFRDQDWMT